MAYVTHTCGNCGRDLGQSIVPVLRIDPDFNGEKGRVTDPDCRKCNPYYDDECKKCGETAIDPKGVCLKCGCKM